MDIKLINRLENEIERLEGVIMLLRDENTKLKQKLQERSLELEHINANYWSCRQQSQYEKCNNKKHFYEKL